MGNTLTSMTQDVESKEHPYWTRAEVALFYEHFSSPADLTLEFENSVISSFNTYIDKCFKQDLGEKIDSLEDISMYLGKIMRSSTEVITQFIYRPVLLYVKEAEGNNENPPSLLFLSISFDYATSKKYTKNDLIIHATKLHNLFLRYCEDRGLTPPDVDASGNCDSTCDIGSLITWMNECYPCLPRILLENW